MQIFPDRHPRNATDSYRYASQRGTLMLGTLFAASSVLDIRLLDLIHERMMEQFFWKIWMRVL